MADTDNQDEIRQRVQTSTPLDTPQSDAAVDDIVAKEADKLLAAEDANAALQAEQNDADEPQRLRSHPIFWTAVAFMVIVVLFVAYVLLSPGLSVAP